MVASLVRFKKFRDEFNKVAPEYVELNSACTFVDLITLMLSTLYRNAKRPNKIESFCFIVLAFNQ